MMDNSAENSAKKRKQPRGKPFTPETSKAVQAKAIATRELRRQMRRKMLEAVMDEGLDKYLVKALKTLDTDAMTVVEKASKLVGLDFASSDEAAQNIKVEAKTDSTVDTTVKFVLGERPTKG